MPVHSSQFTVYRSQSATVMDALLLLNLRNITMQLQKRIHLLRVKWYYDFRLITESLVINKN